jgi:NADH/NAD ratio-sensing transcriptional regulator Rex
VGKQIDEIPIQHLTELPKLDRELGVTVALVACSPGWVQMTIDLLDEAGIEGVLLLTPAIKINRPEGMEISHVRMPCDIKSLACRCHLPRFSE